MHAIFLDLDGTLIDPKVGISNAIRHALAGLGAEVPPAEDLTWCIGPPAQHNFEVLLGPGADLDAAVALYREHFAETGMYEAELYDGVGEMLMDLRDTGAGLWIATSKPHVFASQMVEHFGIAAWVDGVFGSELDGRNADKTDLLAHALAETGVEPENAVMIGDRRFDVHGARNNGIMSLAALWGYADPDELSLAEPDRMAGHPLEVGEIVAEMLGLID
jgi:phosphoglycolate phosphatase